MSSIGSAQQHLESLLEPVEIVSHNSSGVDGLLAFFRCSFQDQVVSLQVHGSKRTLDRALAAPDAGAMARARRCMEIR